MNLAPVVLFVYNRPKHTEDTLNALKKNIYASMTDVIIYSDGPKSSIDDDEKNKINKTREICKQVNGFKSVTLFELNENKGLAQNIIVGITEIINKYGKIIVLEDDIITGKFFLKFMNESLNKYEKSEKVYAVSGWYYPISCDKSESFFLSSFNCWGWATWKHRWGVFNKDTTYYMKYFTKEQIHKFNIDNNFDYWGQMIDNYKGIRDTWFIFWYASVFLRNGLCLYPSKSLVRNSGCDGSGENCNQEIYIQNMDIDMKIDLFPETEEINLEKKNELIKYLKHNNKKFFFRNILRNFLRKFNLYGVARYVYKKIVIKF